MTLIKSLQVKLLMSQQTVWQSQKQLRTACLKSYDLGAELALTRLAFAEVEAVLVLSQEHLEHLKEECAQYAKKLHVVQRKLLCTCGQFLTEFVQAISLYDTL